MHVWQNDASSAVNIRIDVPSAVYLSLAKARSNLLTLLEPAWLSMPELITTLTARATSFGVPMLLPFRNPQSSNISTSFVVNQESLKDGSQRRCGCAGTTLPKTADKSSNAVRTWLLILADISPKLDSLTYIEGNVDLYQFHDKALIVVPQRTVARIYLVWDL